MVGQVSRRTAEIALVALDRLLEREQRRRNGGVQLSQDVRTAYVELQAAAVSRSRQNFDVPGPDPAEWVTTREAARRLGCSTRTVQRRVATGQLEAELVGNANFIRWTGDLEWQHRRQARRRRATA